MTKKQTVLKQIKNYFFVALGTLIYTFGCVVFLSKAEIVSGGMSGVAIIIQHFAGEVYVYDYITSALTILFWLAGLIILGKEFALKTLVSSITYIAFTFIFARLPVFDNLASQFCPVIEGIRPVGNLILCAIFGGLICGVGIGITFIAGGSTGGFDVISIALRKYTGTKENVTSAITNIIIIVIGMLTMRQWNEALCGIISAVMNALGVQLVYINRQSCYQAEIISDKYVEISEYITKTLGRGTTILDAAGGYDGETRKIIKCAFDKTQYEEIKQHIAEIDPTAFVLITQSDAIYGRGFDRIILKKEKKSKDKKNDKKIKK